MPKNSSYTYEFSATLRIWECGPLHAEISEVTGLLPSIVYRKGERRNKLSTKVREHDLWALDSDLPKSEPLSDHIMRIREMVMPHKKYFKSLIRISDGSDIILGCYTGCTYPVFCVEPKALRFVSSLDLGMAFNFTVGK